MLWQASAIGLTGLWLPDRRSAFFRINLRFHLRNGCLNILTLQPILGRFQTHRPILDRGSPEAVILQLTIHLGCHPILHRGQRGNYTTSSNTNLSNGSTGSTTDACWNPSETFRQQRPKQASTQIWKLRSWPRNLNQSASGKPGAAHLEALGVIKDRVALLSPVQVGCKSTVFAAITLADHSEKTVSGFAQLIEGRPKIVECLATSGTADYQMKVRVADVEAYEKFITQTLLRSPFVREIHSSLVLKELKSTTAVPV